MKILDKVKSCLENRNYNKSCSPKWYVSVGISNKSTEGVYSVKLKQGRDILLYGVSFFIFLTFGYAQNKNLAKVNSMPITGTWKVDSVDFKTEKNSYLKKVDVYIKFDSNLILASGINDSIGFCYLHSVKTPNTISLLIYFSMYQLKFPYIYQVNSKEAIEYFKKNNCNNLKFKTLKFERSKSFNDKLEQFFLKVTNTYKYSLKEESLVLESNNLKIYLHRH
ncbi:hypothetical protein QNI16_05490 [Cytophagaceae bacterium YF14B1]|uniref:Uncharacterized protein n=2 Tax=Xanthocytophaga flava TaxID=3048013 RepID=A0AAE3QM20_9BACT|nr:hypothetical protein [Xanthocytophaga flavus]